MNCVDVQCAFTPKLFCWDKEMWDEVGVSVIKNKTKQQLLFHLLAGPRRLETLVVYITVILINFQLRDAVEQL